MHIYTHTHTHPFLLISLFAVVRDDLTISSLVLLQRATLAEKEVTTLKEQLANNPPSSGDGIKDGSNNNLERHSFENEIAAKDKEVSLVRDSYLL